MCIVGVEALHFTLRRVEMAAQAKILNVLCGYTNKNLKSIFLKIFNIIKKKKVGNRRA